MLKDPSFVTLKKYGLTLEEWKQKLQDQGNVCFICKKEPSTGRLCVDHEHVKGWKKLPPEIRKNYVRGILCWYCNGKFLSKGITLDKAKNVVKYLEEYELKKQQILAKSMPENLLKE